MVTEHCARSDDLVQPAPRRTLTGVQKGFEPVVPRFVEEPVDLVEEVVSLKAAFTTAALSRSSGIMMSPRRPVTAW